MRQLAAMMSLAAAFPISASASPRHSYAELSTTDREEFLDGARRTSPLPARIDVVSAPFIGTPYGISPLGEDSGVDADPRLRWDLVDCLTFVETTLAMALSPSNERLLPVLDDIRYSATPPDFERRNHIVEAQWVPNNVAKGYLRPISRTIAGDETMVATIKLNTKRWHARSDPSELPLSDGAVPKGDFSLDIVPIAFAAAHLAQIPGGTILFVVRDDAWAVPTRVSHVGFVLDRDGKKFLRHAAKDPYNQVIDEPLESFIERNSRYEGRKVVGFSLYEVLQPVKRIADLPVTSSVHLSPTTPP